ncbi:MAG: UDP-glucose 4-epimerase GalE, partial [Candidatus Saccharimonadales bacterium]
VSVVDNLSNSSAESLRRVEKLTGKKVKFYEFDLRDEAKLESVFSANKFGTVIHFAGLKAVGESVAKPLEYYLNNLVSSLALCKIMQKYGVRQLIFSSSATVYGNPSKVPIDETARLSPTNPYGQTKFMIEQILHDLVAAGDGWRVSILRYFNPIGAHESGQIGEDPSGIPNNLLPYIAQVASGKLPELAIFGDDYDTPDGTGVRDYIHVVDLAKGHLAALGKPPQSNSCAVYNLGTGLGLSVMEVIKAFELASGKPIAYKVIGRRPGDIAACYADASKAKRELDWQTSKSLAEACADSWRWQLQNPSGYN